MDVVEFVLVLWELGVVPGGDTDQSIEMVNETASTMTSLTSPPHRKMVSVGSATALEPLRKDFLASLHQLEKMQSGSESQCRQAFSSA